MALFGNDFYPTPSEVASQMLDPLDLRGKVVLEPSAGSGNLVRECLQRGAAEVLWCETEHELCSVLSNISTKSHKWGSDFLVMTADQISHIDIIAMNPPFSADETHILHAWEIAPPGCEIVALCNWETVDNTYSWVRKELATLIECYGSKQNLGDAFSDAERKTSVKIGLVRLTKPGTKPGLDEFDCFFLGPDDIEAEGEGIIPYRVTRDIVNRYTQACKIYDEQLEAAAKLHSVLDGYYGEKIGLQVTEKGVPVSRNRFRKDLQKEAWNYVFKRILPLHMATSGLRNDINQFVEDQSHIPFTERNILRMVQIVMGTHEQRIDRAVEEVFDSFTRYTKENRWNVEGWATNDQYLFNRKFIVPGLSRVSWANTRLVTVESYGSRYNQVDDLIKALCTLSGKNYEDYKAPESGFDKNWPGEWYNWGFFKFKAHKKGTVHFEFIDEDDWARLNQRVAKIKGLTLPEKLNSRVKTARKKTKS